MEPLSFKEGENQTPLGQIHWQCWTAAPIDPFDDQTPVLVCLHPLPHNGLFFETIALYLAKGRIVLAPDYPGYGQSSVLSTPPTIDIYAESVMALLGQLPWNPPVDLFGFHTGCLVAVELSLRYGIEMNRLVLVDVPFFDTKKRKELLQSEAARDGFVAAFSYPIQKRFSRVSHDCLVIATQSSLLEPSREAAAVLGRCELQEQLEVSAPALVNGAESIACASLEFLNAED